MNKLLKVSTLLLAVAAALPVAAQSPTRVQGEPLREQRDDEREQPRSREQGRKPMPAVAGSHDGRQGRDRQWSGDGRQYDGRDGRGQYDGRNHRDNRHASQPYLQHGGQRHDGRRDDRHRDNRYYGNGWSGGHDRRDWRDDHRDWRRDQRRHASYRYRAPHRYVYPRGYRHYDWRVGYYLPAPYYSSYYYVDYGYYRLPPPPRGYRWIRVDNDVYLVAIGSGLIRDILYGLFY